MGQEAVDVGFGKLAGMGAGVEEQEATDPVDISFLGAAAAMPGPQGFHAPQEAARILAEAIDYARQGQLGVLRAR